MPAELRAIARSAKEPTFACGRGRALPDAGTGSVAGDFVREPGVSRGATGETGDESGGGAGVCGGAGGGVTVVFSTRTGTGSLVTTAPLTVAIGLGSCKGTDPYAKHPTLRGECVSGTWFPRVRKAEPRRQD